MNCTTIEGNAFKISDTDATITDIVNVEHKIVETVHNPYLNSSR